MAARLSAFRPFRVLVLVCAFTSFQWASGLVELVSAAVSNPTELIRDVPFQPGVTHVAGSESNLVVLVTADSNATSPSADRVFPASVRTPNDLQQEGAAVGHRCLRIIQRQRPISGGISPLPGVWPSLMSDTLTRTGFIDLVFGHPFSSAGGNGRARRPASIVVCTRGLVKCARSQPWVGGCVAGAGRERSTT